MKILLHLFLYLYPVTILFGQDASSFYQLSVALKDTGRSINMVACQGKKVLVAVCDAYEPDIPLLAQLDELQQKYHDRLVVIVVPLNDLNASNKTVDANLLQGIPGNYEVAKLSAGKKSGGSAQHPLLRWVTHQSENRHFNHDIKEGGYLFVISETGRLFAVLKRSGSIEQDIVLRILNSKVADH